MLDFLKLIIVSIECFLRKVYNETAFVLMEALVANQVAALGFGSGDFWGFNKGPMLM